MLVAAGLLTDVFPPGRGVAAAQHPDPRIGWAFDRLTWSPGGDSLAFEAVQRTYPNVPLDLGRLTFVVDVNRESVAGPPEARAFQVSRDGSKALILGSFGLWLARLDTGETRQIHFTPPGAPARVFDFAFEKDGRGILFLLGAAGDSTGGLYGGSEAEAPSPVAPFEPGSPEPPPEWLSRADPNPPPPIHNARGPRRFKVPGLNFEFRYDGDVLAQVQGVGELGASNSVEIAWASWPPAGGVALVALHSPRSPGGQGEVRRFLPGGDQRRLMNAASPQVAWIDDRRALLNPGGRLHVYDSDTDSLTVLDLQSLPVWAGDLAPAIDVATVQVDRWPRSARDLGSQRSLLKKCARDMGKQNDNPFLITSLRTEGILNVGVFPSPASAAAAARVLEEHGIRARPATAPARSFTGRFDFGHVTSSAGWTAYLSRADEAGQFTEMWIVPPGGPPRRLVPAWILK